MTLQVPSEVSMLQGELIRAADELGVNKMGFAPVERWETHSQLDPEFWPQNIWPWARTVISVCLQIFPGMIETTPSSTYAELYNTTNRLLDDTTYRLANLLNRRGHRAHFFPRDCYGDIRVLVEKPEAAFSQVVAGMLSGLGTIGMNHTLLTPEFGPRHRLGCVITDAVLEPTPLIEGDLCIRCGQCVRNCPQHAFTPRDDRVIADMDKHACALYHAQLKDELNFPCGVCCAVCPVGEDRKIYGAHSVTREGARHVQSYGSWGEPRA